MKDCELRGEVQSELHDVERSELHVLDHEQHVLDHALHVLHVRGHVQVHCELRVLELDELSGEVVRWVLQGRVLCELGRGQRVLRDVVLGGEEPLLHGELLDAGALGHGELQGGALLALDEGR